MLASRTWTADNDTAAGNESTHRTSQIMSCNFAFGPRQYSPYVEASRKPGFASNSNSCIICQMVCKFSDPELVIPPAVSIVQRRCLRTYSYGWEIPGSQDEIICLWMATGNVHTGKINERAVTFGRPPVRIADEENSWYVHPSWRLIERKFTPIKFVGHLNFR